MTRARLCAAGAALLFCAGDGRAQDATGPHPVFTWKDAALFGGFVVATLAVAPSDRGVAQRLQRADVQSSRGLDRAATAFETMANPGAAIGGVVLYAYGRARDNRQAADVGLHGVEALVATRAIGTLLKGAFGRARPYVNMNRPRDFRAWRGFREGPEYRSFPSGHTYAAFTAAAVVTSETRRSWPASAKYVAPVMFGGAAAVGLSRMYHNVHWASDVVAGAAVGSLVGLTVVRWNHANPDNRLDRLLLGASIAPGPAGSATVRVQLAP